MSLRLITPPTVEPVSLAEAKLSARVTHADEDAWFSEIAIPSAREEVEHQLGRALIHQTWELTLDAFPAEFIRLDYPPLASVTVLQYVDPDGNLQTWPTPKYYVDTSIEPGQVLPAYGQEWPETRDQANAMILRYVAGYGADAAAVPAAIRNWMLVTIGTAYKVKESYDVKAVVKHQFVDGLLDRYRMLHI